MFLARSLYCLETTFKKKKRKKLHFGALNMTEEELPLVFYLLYLVVYLLSHSWKLFG